jgi:predicted DNA-binding transcriptional regulator AlpA
LQKYYSDKQLGERYGVDRRTIWRWVRQGFIPKPVKLSERSTRWDLDEILLWDGRRRGWDDKAPGSPYSRRAEAIRGWTMEDVRNFKVEDK